MIGLNEQLKISSERSEELKVAYLETIHSIPVAGDMLEFFMKEKLPENELIYVVFNAGRMWGY